MRLSLLNWPPVASHTVCILMGFAISNLQQDHQTQLEETKKRDHQHHLWIPMRSALLENTQLKSIKTGAQFFLVKPNHDRKTFCRLSPVPIHLNKTLDGPVLEFNWTELPQLAHILAFPERYGAKLAPFAKSKFLPKCLEKKEVSYDFF